MIARLVEIRKGSITGNVLDIGPETYIGRPSPDKGPVDIDLSSYEGGEYVSRLHARIFFDINERAWYIEDLGSKNGTFVRRGKETFRIVDEPFKLSNGDIICFYALCFKFEEVEHVSQKRDKTSHGEI